MKDKDFAIVHETEDSQILIHAVRASDFTVDVIEIKYWSSKRNKAHTVPLYFNRNELLEVAFDSFKDAKVATDFVADQEAAIA